jgi:hypothetical protein
MKCSSQKEAYVRIVRGAFMGIFILTLLSACNGSEKIKDPIPIDTGSSVIKQRLMNELQENEIPFTVIDETAIEVPRQDIQATLLELNRIENAVLPTKRSTALPQPGRATFIRLLNRHNVVFQEVKYAGQEWIVWEEEDHEKVLDLLERAIAIHRP